MEVLVTGSAIVARQGETGEERHRSAAYWLRNGDVYLANSLRFYNAISIKWPIAHACTSLLACAPCCITRAVA